MSSKKYKRLIPARQLCDKQGTYSDEHGFDSYTLSCSYDEYPIDPDILAQAIANNETNVYEINLWRNLTVLRRGPTRKGVINKF
jgi:hypothetical protein